MPRHSTQNSDTTVCPILNASNLLADPNRPGLPDHGSKCLHRLTIPSSLSSCSRFLKYSSAMRPFPLSPTATPASDA